MILDKNSLQRKESHNRFVPTTSTSMARSLVPTKDINSRLKVTASFLLLSVNTKNLFAKNANRIASDIAMTFAPLLDKPVNIRRR